MNSRSLGLWFALLALLAAAAWWQLHREAVAPAVGEQSLIAGFDRARTKRIRLDQLVYGLQLELELAADGHWQIVDPLDYPADPTIVGWLLDALAQTRCTAAPGVQLEQVGLARPRAVLVVQEEIDGKPRESRLEIGADDVDADHLFARVDGRVVRATKAVYDVVDRPRDGWRSHAIDEFDPRSIVELKRTGLVQPPGDVPPLDLELDAYFGPSGWAAAKPFEAALDPTYVYGWLTALRSLQAKSFVDEATGKPALVGLDHPGVMFELADAGGKREVLSFARDHATSSWFCMRSSAPYIWRVDLAAVAQLVGSTDAFVDRQFERLPKGDVDLVSWTYAGRETRLERAKDGWTVGLVDHGQLGERVPADDAKVDDFLGAIGRLTMVQRVSQQAFPEGAPTAELRVGSKGVEFVGRWGPETTTPEGGHGHLFQRANESLVFLVDPAALELPRVSVDGLRSLQVLRLRELELKVAVLARGEKRLTFQRSDRGRWSPEGVDQEAKDFAALVDRLISIRAHTWLPATETAPLTESIEVMFKDAYGTEHPYRVGRLGELTVCEFNGRRAVVESELLRDLARLPGLAAP